MFFLGAITGGVIIYLCPGVGTGGSALYKRFIKPLFDNDIKF